MRIDAEQVMECRRQFVSTDRTFYGIGTVSIAGTDDAAAFDTRSRQGHGKTRAQMIAATISDELGSTTEFTEHGYEGFGQGAAFFEILRQSPARLDQTSGQQGALPKLVSAILLANGGRLPIRFEGTSSRAGGQ